MFKIFNTSLTLDAVSVLFRQQSVTGRGVEGITGRGVEGITERGVEGITERGIEGITYLISCFSSLAF